MIKDVLASVTNNKAVGDSAKASKEGAANEVASKSGLFGMILNSMSLDCENPQTLPQAKLTVDAEAQPQNGDSSEAETEANTTAEVLTEVVADAEVVAQQVIEESKTEQPAAITLDLPAEESIQAEVSSESAEAESSEVIEAQVITEPADPSKSDPVSDVFIKIQQTIEELKDEIKQNGNKVVIDRPVQHSASEKEDLAPVKGVSAENAPIREAQVESEPKTSSVDSADSNSSKEITQSVVSPVESGNTSEEAEATATTNPISHENNQSGEKEVLEQSAQETGRNEKEPIGESAGKGIETNREPATGGETAKSQLRNSAKPAVKEAQPETQTLKKEEAQEVKTQHSTTIDGGAEKTEEAPELNAGVQNSKAELIREMKYKDRYSLATNRAVVNEERASLLANLNSSQNSVSQNGGFVSVPDYTQQLSDQSLNQEFSSEQEQMLQDNLMEITEVEDHAQPEQFNTTFNRLGELTVTNVSVRKNIIPGFNQAVQKATSGANGSPENWQKHSFSLDDGNKIDVSTREVDGVLQLKVASSNPELTRLIQEYEQEIKEHLEKEYNMSVDLQFDGASDHGQSDFFGNDGSHPANKGNGKGSMPGERNSTQKVQQPVLNAVRRFGYNQMEWTA